MDIYRIFDFKDEEEWLSGRMNGIGGSDASAVVGVNPYKTNIQLFEEKTGKSIPEDISDKPIRQISSSLKKRLGKAFRKISQISLMSFMVSSQKSIFENFLS